jgi:cytochrome c biogenesis protein CcmG, thiol:disulfide interchange protein DsbE
MFGFRSIITIFIFSSFLFYGQFLSSKRNRYFNFEQEFILEHLPPVTFNFVKKDNLSGSKGSFFHFWATWCGPCEKELPEFIKFIDSFNGKFKGVLVASKDEKSKVVRYLKRFNLGTNFIIAHDPNGELLKNFGSLRVPETFLFDSNGLFFKKYVGPQDWLNPFFFQNTNFLFN